jgi:hypothetical protein
MKEEAEVVGGVHEEVRVGVEEGEEGVGRIGGCVLVHGGKVEGDGVRNLEGHNNELCKGCMNVVPSQEGRERHGVSVGYEVERK